MNDDLINIQHLGDDYDKYLNAVVPPIFMNTLHVFPTFEDYSNVDHRQDGNFNYGRTANPTVSILEQKIAALEHGAKAVAFSSGMGAAAAAILTTCNSGSHIICMRDVYGPVKAFIKNMCIAKFDMSVTYIKGTDLEELENAIRPETSLIIVESPATFVFSVVDLRKIAEIGKANGIKTYIDNSYCTPLFQKPLDLGFDIVMHTLSKYIGGHSDIIGGILTSKDEELLYKIQLETREWVGSIISPFNAWLAIRGLRTLGVRVKEHEVTAIEVAEFLEKHPKVKIVNYPGLKSHPQRELIEKQQTGNTSLMSLVLKGLPDDAVKFINNLKLFGKGCSWGGYESLALCPLYHSSKEDMELLQLTDHDRGLIRLYCGLEGTENLIKDLDQALDKI